MILIESKENSIFKEIRKLHERKNRNKLSKFIIEGFRLIEEAFISNVPIDYIIISKSAKEKISNYNIDTDSIKCYEMPDNLLKELAFTDSPQGIVAVIQVENQKISESGSFYLLCDKVQDPGNMGTIIRTADAAGADGIILTKGTVDIYNEKVIRSTMGSIFHIPIFYDNDLSEVKKLKSNGFKLIVTALDAENNFFEQKLDGKIILTVGNEGNGVSNDIVSLADIKVKIPMSGKAESLNVSIASGIIMYERVRQQNI
ncbi:RNA methyltransferase [Clostridium sp. BJN0001]|uniref:TrmH family RNA methyltransferase n=1 Tax=Clostridium sp. BJN0001 TaxID=2930219 RepID=UPI001FD24805|nr:RNA methyltransferase [Clostridium sp. BJN0001]